MASTPRLSEIEGEPEIGKYYLVPCLMFADRELVPIIGNQHEDADIGVPESHYHYDMRFLSNTLIHRTIVRYEAAVCADEQFMMGFVPNSGGDTVKEKKLKCRRKMPVFPLIMHIKPLKFIKKLEKANKNKTLNCLQCPHRGMLLSKQNADEAGNVVCHGHGLQWNLETGQLVSRLSTITS